MKTKLLDKILRRPTCSCREQEPLLDALRHGIKEQIRETTIRGEIDTDGDPYTLEELMFPLSNDEWEHYAEYNVSAILCSLNRKEDDVTVINCIFHKNGHIPPLRHERIKRIFVIYGELEDTITGKIIKTGEVYTIPPLGLHSLKSDHAMITITWQPAYH